MYYLDARTIREIASELRCSREAVRDAVDDPTAQKEYLDAIERIRRRTRLRAAAAAEAALDRQIEFVASADVPADLRAAQMMTAERMLRRGLDHAQDEGHEISLRIEGVDTGMPPGVQTGTRRIFRRKKRPEKSGV